MIKEIFKAIELMNDNDVITVSKVNGILTFSNVPIERKKWSIGDTCLITENVRVLLGLQDGLGYEIKDIIKDEVEFHYVLTCDELGNDWVQFFKESELVSLPF